MSIFHNEGYTKYPFRCVVDSKPCTDWNIRDNSTIWFAFRISGGAPKKKPVQASTAGPEDLPLLKAAKPTPDSEPIPVPPKPVQQTKNTPTAMLAGLKPRTSTDFDEDPTSRPDYTIRKAIEFWHDKTTVPPEYLLRLRQIQLDIVKPWVRICFASSWLLWQFTNHYELSTWLREAFDDGATLRIFMADTEVPDTQQFKESWHLNIRLADGVTHTPCVPRHPAFFGKYLVSTFILHAEETADHIGIQTTIRATPFELEYRARETIWNLYNVEDAFYSLKCRDTGFDLRSCRVGGDVIEVHWRRSIFSITYPRLTTPYSLNLKMDSGIELRVGGPMLILPRRIREVMFEELSAPTGEYWLKLDGGPFKLNCIKKVVTDVRVESKGPGGCCERDQGCIRVLIDNCPKMKMAVLDSLTPTTTLYGLIQERGYKEASFKLHLGPNMLTDEIIYDGAVIHFEERYILIFIEDCPHLTQCSVPMSTPWTALQAKIAGIGYPANVYTCSINTQLCTDLNIQADGHIRFHITGLGGGATGPVIEDDLLDDVDYPASSSSSDSEGDSFEEFKNALQQWKTDKRRLEEKCANFEKLVEN
jgi:hypothetical protein